MVVPITGSISNNVLYMTTLTEQMQERNQRINSLMYDLWDIYTDNDPEASTKNNRVWDRLVKFEADTITATLKEVERVVEGESNKTLISPESETADEYAIRLNERKYTLDTILTRIQALSKVTGE